MFSTIPSSGDKHSERTRLPFSQMAYANVSVTLCIAWRRTRRPAAASRYRGGNSDGR